MSPKVREFIQDYLDGYPICDYCKGNLLQITKPPLGKIIEKLTDTYQMDSGILTFGAREAMAMAMRSVLKPGDAVVVDQNRHYTSVLAIEAAGAKFVEAKTSGYPEYEVKPEAFEKAIEKVVRSRGKKPSLIILTHVDGGWGNLVDAETVGEIALKYEIPFLLNAAYSAGRFRFSGKEIGADFMALSAHKSFGSTGPVGALLYSDKWSDRIEKTSEYYPEKNLNVLGCSARGTAVVAFYKTMEELDERLARWDAEVERTRQFVKELEEMSEGGIKQLGIRPKEHDLVYLETPLLYEMGLKRRKKGYFLAEELKKRGIIGIQPGRTKGFKLSIYGLTDSEVEHVLNSFKEILNEG